MELRFEGARAHDRRSGTRTAPSDVDQLHAADEMVDRWHHRRLGSFAPIDALGPLRHSAKYQVSGCAPPGVRQCCAMQTRCGTLWSLLLVTRTPRKAGDWPTVPIPYC